MTNENEQADVAVLDSPVATIKVTLEGAVTGIYEGKPGLSLKEMFPVLAAKACQTRVAGKMQKQAVPIMESFTVKTTAHAKHG